MISDMICESHDVCSACVCVCVCVCVLHQIIYLAITCMISQFRITVKVPVVLSVHQLKP